MKPLLYQMVECLGFKLKDLFDPTAVARSVAQIRKRVVHSLDKPANYQSRRHNQLFCNKCVQSTADICLHLN